MTNYYAYKGKILHYLPNFTPNRFYLLYHLTYIILLLGNYQLNIIELIRSYYSYCLIGISIKLKIHIYTICIIYLLTLKTYHLLSKITINILFFIFLLVQLILLAGDIHPNPGPYSGQSINYLNICHINARSITAPSRLDDIIDYTTVLHSFDIFAISETHLGPTIPDTQIQIDNYTLYRKDRDRRGGGVCLYISNLFTSKRRIDLEPDNAEMIWAEITFKSQKILISCTYRPPGGSDDTIQSFFDSLQHSLDLATQDN
jgi:hypothetical protein